MKLPNFRVSWRLVAVLMAVLPTGCLEAIYARDSPLMGAWTNTDNDQILFKPDTIVMTPNKGQPTAMTAAECNGVFKLAYGRMETAPLADLFPRQPDLRDKLKALLVKPEYPVADVTCDQGGTTYLLLDDHDVLAIYRDGAVGGVEQLTRI
jgi:hypothetical protein